MMPHKRSLLALMGLLVLFASPSAADTPTNTVVSKHVVYESFLVLRSIRYIPEALDTIRKVAVEGEECEIDQELASKLNKDASAQVRAYIDELCRPWQEWLETISSPCDSEPAPKDCEDGWLKLPLSEFLKSAKPVDLIVIERQLKGGWVGLPRPLADIFRDYASRLAPEDENAQRIRTLASTRFDE